MSSNLEIAYNPYEMPTVSRFHESDAFIRVLGGPVGSGKSTAGILFEFLLRAGLWTALDRPEKCQAAAPDGTRYTRWLILRSSYSRIKESVMKTWSEHGVSSAWPIKQTAPFTCHIKMPLPDGTKMDAEFVFMGLDGADSAVKMQSMLLTGVGVEEATELDESVMITAFTRCGRYPGEKLGGCTWYGLWAVNNYGAKGHWSMRMLRGEKTESIIKLEADMKEKYGITRPFLESFRQPAAMYMDERGFPQVNPEAENLKRLPVGYYDVQYQLLTEEKRQAYLFCQFVDLQAGAPVTPDFADLHIDKTAKFHPSYPIFIGMDFGRSPAACIGQLMQNGQYVVLKELTSSGVSAETFVETLLLPCLANDFPNAHVELIVGDPAGGAKGQAIDLSAFDVLDRAGFDVIPASSIKPEARQVAMNHFLRTLNEGKPAFAIHPSCEVAIRGFEGAYHFKQVKDEAGVFKAEPAKTFESHICEAVMYLAMHFYYLSGKQRREAERAQRGPKPKFQHIRR